MRRPAGDDGLAPTLRTGRTTLARRLRTAPATAAAVALTGLLSASALYAVPAHAVTAKPKPSRKQLTAQQQELSDQAEQLTEQYNGLRLRLRQARRAAQIAEENAARQQKALEGVRAHVARIAADAYKTGSDDPITAFLASDDYQATLDRAAVVSYVARQGNTQLSMLLQTMQAADRARKEAETRSAEVRALTTKNQLKQRQVTSLLAKVEKQLGKPANSRKVGPAPDIAAGGASAKAVGAVRAALAERGVPYSWGGGSSSGPTYGVAQGANIKGFDCSGLTLYAYAQVGISLPHYTGDQFKAGTHVSLNQLRPGDLVFFYSDLHHMGMYIGNGQMIHAPQTGDVVKVSPISGRPFAGGVRIA